MRAKIVVANWVDPEILDFLRRHAEVVANPDRQPFPRSVLLDHCRNADALIAFMSESVNEDFLCACPRLRIIACALKGYDNFDVEACTRHGVWLTIVPDRLSAPTAELTLGLIIALGRNVIRGADEVRAGGFAGWRPHLYGQSVDGSTVGLIGAGAVGKAIARRLTGFRCELLYHDNHRVPRDQELDLRLQPVSLAELCARSHFTVLAVPLTVDTYHMVDTRFISRMRRGSHLVNPARGSLVDEDAVIQALESGQLGGYAADAFECEDWARADRPTGIDSRLYRAVNTVLTPHLGSAVATVRREIARDAAHSVVQCLRGARPDGAVNTPASGP